MTQHYVSGAETAPPVPRLVFEMYSSFNFIAKGDKFSLLTCFELNKYYYFCQLQNSLISIIKVQQLHHFQLLKVMNSMKKAKTFQKRGRGSTVVKVLCYKREGRWFHSRWCHWNFSLT